MPKKIFEFYDYPTYAFAEMKKFETNDGSIEYNVSWRNSRNKDIFRAGFESYDEAFKFYRDVLNEVLDSLAR